MKKTVVPKLRQEVKVDIVTSDDIKIYYTWKFQNFTSRYIIKQFNGFLHLSTFFVLIFNLFSNNPLFLRVCDTSLSKTLWEKEQFLLFPQRFLPFQKTFHHFYEI